MLKQTRIKNLYDVVELFGCYEKLSSESKVVFGCLLFKIIGKGGLILVDIFAFLSEALTNMGNLYPQLFFTLKVS